jgi:hypothetical protein
VLDGEAEQLHAPTVHPSADASADLVSWRCGGRPRPRSMPGSAGAVRRRAARRGAARLLPRLPSAALLEPDSSCAARRCSGYWRDGSGAPQRAPARWCRTGQWRATRRCSDCSQRGAWWARRRRQRRRR